MCVRFWGGGTERQRESVCLDQLHSKSVYSAQFGIKHNRLLSACCCVWRPIKMEFIAALRANPNYTFFSPQHSVFLHHASLFCASSSPRGDGWMLLAAAVWWEVLTVHYGPRRGHMLDMPTYLSSFTWVKRMLHIALEKCSAQFFRLWWHLVHLSADVAYALKRHFCILSILSKRWKRRKASCHMRQDPLGGYFKTV